VPVPVALEAMTEANSYPVTVVKVAKQEFADTLKNSPAAAVVGHTVGGTTPTEQIIHRVLQVLVVLAVAVPDPASTTIGPGLELVTDSQTPAAAAAVPVVTVTLTPSVAMVVQEL
jgi:hypothetical protein